MEASSTAGESTAKAARFTVGSIARHVLVMTLTGAIGTMALFLVDLTSLFYLAQLQQTAITAAMGYASSVIFFSLSVGLGTGVAASALVSRSVGAGDIVRARGYATSSLMFAFLSSAVITIILVVSSGQLLSLMNAAGLAKELAQSYIWAVSPGLVMFGVSLTLSAILRGLGDARRAMYVLLAMASVTIMTAPVLIFGLHMGIQGAAVAAVLGHLAALCMGLHGVVRVHGFLDPLRFAALKRDIGDIWTIAYPAGLSQLTVPLGNAYVTFVLAEFGDEAVAGFAIISRLMPVAFGIALALSSAVGPVIGQNYGAGLFQRVRRTLTQSVLMATGYTLCASLVLLALATEIAEAFNATGIAHDEIVFFCSYLAISWIFVGALFIANSAFNTLGYPKRSAAFSWGRVTFGTVPFIHLGAEWGGWQGVLIGNAMGVAIFGALALAFAYRVTSERSLSARSHPAHPPEPQQVTL
jgi:putative MATE family efflux protein